MLAVNKLLTPQFVAVGLIIVDKKGKIAKGGSPFTCSIEGNML